MENYPILIESGLRLAAAFMLAVHVGTMGRTSVMAGRPKLMSIPARIRISQGLLSISFLGTAYAGMGGQGNFYHLGNGAIAFCTLIVSGLWVHLFYSQPMTMPERSTLLWRTIPFAALILVAGSFLMGWGYKMGHNTKAVINTSANVVITTDTTKADSTRR